MGARNFITITYTVQLVGWHASSDGRAS